MNKTAKTVVLTLSALAALCLATLFLPPLQAALIALVERLKDDDIRDVFWKQQMRAFATCGILFLAILNLVLWTKKGRNIFDDFCMAVKQECAFIAQNKKYFFFFLAAYFFGYFTIIRGNFCYIAIDDLPRQLEGCRDWVNWYRYIDEFGSILLHTSTRLMDIAPLTQFVAILFVSLASFVAVQAATEKKMGWFACIASLPIGLFPFFLTNISYRFDSPYMAISVCACVIPFVFRENKATYAIASVLGVLAMCTSYQASSGIYIVFTMFIVLKMILDNKSWKEIGNFVLISICCYAATLVFFKLTFMEREFKPGSIDERIALSYIAKNAVKYISLIWTGFNGTLVKALFILATLINVGVTVAVSKRSKITSALASLLFYVLAFPMSYGVYIAMADPLWRPRGTYGIASFVAASMLLLFVNSEKANKAVRTIGKVIVFSVSYCFFAFAFAYGNAQFEQTKYAEFRARLLAYDLATVMKDYDNSQAAEIIFCNGIGHAPAVKNLIKVYPLAGSCVDTYCMGHSYTQWILAAIGIVDRISDEDQAPADLSLPVLCETRYHKIQGQGNRYLVTFKNESVKVKGNGDFVTD
jgi:hypothetical protein